MATKAQKMVNEAVSIAKDDSHGYSQDMIGRWNNPDFDCSSLMYWCANKAGYKVTLGPSGTHYTGTMLADFKKAGFTALRFDGNLSDLDPGDIMLNVQNHTEMYIGNGKFVGAHSSEHGTAYGKPGDQTGNEISIVKAYVPSCGWDYVLVPPKESATTATKATNTAMRLYGIDVSSNQPQNIGNMVDYDFLIAKMSGNPQAYSWNYVNPYAKKQCADAVKKGKPIGLYHFTWGKQAEVEAEFFVEQVKKLGYLGKCMLIIDYEAEAVDRGQTWVNKLAKKVHELAGYKPVIYASGSVIVGQNLFSLGYPIWCANYPKGYARIDGYSTSGMSVYKGCEKAVMWQFTSQGYLKGYDAPLDLNAFFGTADDFKALTGAQKAAGAKPAQAAKLAVDGSFGPLTKKELQRQLGVKVTGKFDKATKKALQKRIGVTADGVWGPKSKAAYRRKLGLAETASAKAACKALQKALNAGKVAKW